MSTSLENLINDMVARGSIRVQRMTDGYFCCVWEMFSDGWPWPPKTGYAARSVASGCGPTPAQAIRKAHANAEKVGFA